MIKIVMKTHHLVFSLWHKFYLKKLILFFARWNGCLDHTNQSLLKSLIWLCALGGLYTMLYTILYTMLGWSYMGKAT